MSIDWNLVAAVAMPIITLFLGVWLDQLVQSRPKLISYLGFISSHRINPTSPNTQPTVINTHSVVIRNNGRKAATNVRLGHNFLPDVNVYPDTEYSIKDLPGGGKELVFPTIVPKKEITISYLYFPPTTWNQINTHIESDEGPAKVVTVLLQPQLRPWLIKLLWTLIVLGIISAVYLIIEGILWFAI